MTDVRIAQKEPLKVTVEEGKKYFSLDRVGSNLPEALFRNSWRLPVTALNLLPTYYFKF